MSIADYLPGLPRPYWIDYVYDIEPTKPLVIPAGARNVNIIPSGIVDQRGLFLEFVMNANTPDIEFVVQLDNRRFHATIAQMYSSGYTFYIPNSPFISEYNTTDNIYVVNLIGEIPFRHDMNIYVNNRSSGPAVISDMGVHAVIFRPGFFKALADLKSGKVI